MIGTDRSIVAGIEGRRVKQGLVFGKFMPPTNGHLYLAQFACNACENLTIVVCSMPEEPVPGMLRYQWMKEIFPDCNVVHLDKVMPQEPSNPEDRPFFQLWSDTLNSFCPADKFDALFASESYGYRVADVMMTRFIPVDTAREMVSVSGTAMRQNPFLHWDKLHPVIRPYFIKRIAIRGSESPAKNALLKKLAVYFATSYVADYAETFMSDVLKNIPDYGALTLADISTIARGQIASEEALARQANKIMFVGSELKSIVKLSRSLFGDCPAWVEKEAEKSDYDLYIDVGADTDKSFLQAVDIIHSRWLDLKK